MRLAVGSGPMSIEEKASQLELLKGAVVNGSR